MLNRFFLYKVASWSGSSVIIRTRVDIAASLPVLLVYIRLLIRTCCYITARWSDFSVIKSPADQDPVLFTIMLHRFFWYKVSCRSRSSIISRIRGYIAACWPSRLECSTLLIRIQCYLESWWHEHSALKSSDDKHPVLYNSMRARFFWYKVVCWSGSDVI